MSPVSHAPLYLPLPGSLSVKFNVLRRGSVSSYNMLCRGRGIYFILPIFPCRRRSCSTAFKTSPFSVTIVALLDEEGVHLLYRRKDPTTIQISTIVSITFI